MCQKKVETILTSRNYNFPDDWMGYWEGKLDIHNSSGLNQSLKMALDLDTINGDSILKWTLIYNLEGEKDYREYFLQEVNKEKGHWITDENNSIILDGYVLDNGYYTSFEVGNNRIETSYTLNEDHLYFENRVTKVDAVRISGGQLIDSTKIPEVVSYEVSGIQKARLYKK